jgi:hypothetical protein
MGYGDTAARRRGIKNESIISDDLKRCFEDIGYKNVEITKSALNEDMNDHLDYFVKMRRPNNSEVEFTIDIKNGSSFTPINPIGKNTINSTKADYLVYSFPESKFYSAEYTKHYYFIKFSKFKELYNKYRPPLRDSGDGSRYFFVTGFLKKYKDEFGRDIIKIEK